MPHTIPRILYRSTTNRVFAGVAGGLGEYFSVDPTIFRLLFIILAFAGGGGFIAYLLCWVFIPVEGSPSRAKEDIADRVKDTAEEINESIHTHWRETDSSGRILAGICLVLLGVIFLLANLGLFQFAWIVRYWPLLLIVLGVMLFARGSNRR